MEASRGVAADGEANALRLVSDIRSSVLRVHLRRTRAVSDDAPRAGHHGGRRGRRSGPWQEGRPSIEDSFSSLQGCLLPTIISGAPGHSGRAADAHRSGYPGSALVVRVVAAATWV